MANFFKFFFYFPELNLLMRRSAAISDLTWGFTTCGEMSIDYLAKVLRFYPAHGVLCVKIGLGRVNRGENPTIPPAHIPTPCLRRNGIKIHLLSLNPLQLADL